MPVTLHYIHDPMCSWCWGFRPVLSTLQAALPAEVRFRKLLGGLAPDNDAPMAPELQQQLQDTWRRIQQSIPGTQFNFDFWRACLPRRSTYPACRAVIAARAIQADQEDPMILAIQQAYYTRALNPSEEQTLIQLAGEIGLDRSRFSGALAAQQTDQILRQEMSSARAMGVSSYPSLVLQTDEHSYRPIPIDYRHAERMLHQVHRRLG